MAIIKKTIRKISKTIPTSKNINKVVLKYGSTYKIIPRGTGQLIRK